MEQLNMKNIFYSTEIPAGGHWSLRLRKGTLLRITDLCGDANVGMLFYNPDNLLERYNAPDTLKCQHTFKLTRGHCLYSDMGRIFASIIEDSLGWHETVCGNSNSSHVSEHWGRRNYQKDHNQWHQNGYDAFLVELAKYGLGAADMAANMNWFSKVAADKEGKLSLIAGHSKSGSSITLRLEMDALVLLHACPHPLNRSAQYPVKPIKIDLGEAEPVGEDDYCKNSCSENQRGFLNNRIYHFGLSQGD